MRLTRRAGVDMGLSPRSALRALLLVVATASGAWAEAQQPENIPQDNSDAVARKLFAQLMEKQNGQAPAPDTLWAYEVDFNLDGFSEIYGYVYQPDCDGTTCGLFLFALEGDGYREVLDEVPGARLTDPNKVSLSAFKRNGFMEVRLDQTLAAWKDGRYLDVSRLPGTTLDGAAYLDACEAIPALTAELVQEGRDPSGCVFEIRDAARRLVMEVPFSERRRPVRRPAPSGLSDETAALFARLDRVLLSIRHEQEKLRANMEVARASLDQARGFDGRFF